MQKAVKRDYFRRAGFFASEATKAKEMLEKAKLEVEQMILGE